MSSPNTPSNSGTRKGRGTKNDQAARGYVFDRPASPIAALPRQTPELQTAYRIYGPGISDEDRLKSARVADDVRQKLMADLNITDMAEWVRIQAKAFEDYKAEIQRMAIAEEAYTNLTDEEIARKLFGSLVETPQHLPSEARNLYFDKERRTVLGKDLGLAVDMDNAWQHTIKRALSPYNAQISEARKVYILHKTREGLAAARALEAPDTAALEQAHFVLGPGIETLAQLKEKLNVVLRSRDEMRRTIRKYRIPTIQQYKQVLKDSATTYSNEIKWKVAQTRIATLSKTLSDLESPTSETDREISPSTTTSQSSNTNPPSEPADHSPASERANSSTQAARGDISPTPASSADPLVSPTLSEFYSESYAADGPFRTPEENYIPDPYWLPMDEAIRTVDNMVPRTEALLSQHARMQVFHETSVTPDARLHCDPAIVTALDDGRQLVESCNEYARKFSVLMTHVREPGDEGEEGPEWGWRRAREGNEYVCECIDRIREMDARLGALEEIGAEAEEMMARWERMSMGQRKKGRKRDEWVEEWTEHLKMFAKVAEEGAEEWLSLEELDDMEDAAEVEESDRWDRELARRAAAARGEGAGSGTHVVVDDDDDDDEDMADDY